MAKLVTKFKYLKPNAKLSIGGYAKYIATREGVEKIDDSARYAPATLKQQQFISKLIKDFPDTKDMLEYEDYMKEQTLGNATEFITRALEDNAYTLMNSKTYADYIATRPRAEHFGTHGLFTDDGVQVKLNKVSEELNLHNGNVWTIIISLRREDADRLGFNTGTRWRDMLRTQTEAIATNLKIPMSNLRWYAAFHNEGHHPHVHLIAYSTIENEGFLTKQGVANLRSAFAKDIFTQDLLCIYEKQTMHRDNLRNESRLAIEDIVARINVGSYSNPKLEKMLANLSDKLAKTKGKKVYGYLKADVKALVDMIVEEVGKDENISKLYALWYEQREEVLRTYTEKIPARVPLSQNKEFKSIRNAVIQEAMNIGNVHDEVAENQSIKINQVEINSYNNKVYPTTDTNQYMESTPVIDTKPCMKSAPIIYTKLYVESPLIMDTKTNTESTSVSNTKSDTNSHKNTSTSQSIIRLLYHISKLLLDSWEDDNIQLYSMTDRKLRRKINEKKQAQGLQQR